MASTSYSGPLYSGGVPVFGNAEASYFGTQWFVNTYTGSDSNDGRSPQTAFATMGRAFFLGGVSTNAANVGPNDTIWFIGTIREQLVAPLTKVVGGTSRAITGVQICGMAQGGVRDDDGAKWTYPSSGATAGGALLLCRQQGWVVSNFLMTPEPTSGAAVELRRAEDATYPDASHFIANNMRFVGIDVTTTYGIRDIGGCSNVQVYNSEFYLLTTGLYCSSTAIANPLRWRVIGNRFLSNTNDIIVPSTLGRYMGNMHSSTAATEKVEISGGGGLNTVTGNTFPDVAVDIDPAHGYDGTATDVWTSNSAADAVVFGDPA